ncbi:MAG: YkgJ family cysteine cluster protein [Desulfobacteraceae bacterium]|nr:YkgJ family cysteine cluster protein [Desulfobacteraceae bacterium]
MDFTKYFKAYEELANSINKAFTKIADDFPKEVHCKAGCSDCCHALFDLTLIEAIYISKKFREIYTDDIKRHEILDRAAKADREIYLLKKKAFDDQKNGASDIEIIGKMAMVRVKCPLLNEKNQCDLYDFRPLNCRVYGVPTETGGASHICGRTGFVQGEKYPTIKMDKLYEYLYHISNDMVKNMNTKFIRMGDMLMPVSMALITEFDDKYLGIINENDVDSEEVNDNK